MAAKGDQVAVVTTATRLDTGTAGNMARSSCLVRNRGAVPVYLGGLTVTTANGFQLDPAESVAVDLAPGDALYGVVASGSASCHVLQVGT